jgi:hypothetical protein
MNYLRPRTTIGIKATTKKRLDQFRAPGQCYDGFLCQLTQLWEETHSNGRAPVSTAGMYHSWGKGRVI